ncbi:TolC family protein [Arcobacteraceae bacterium]|nr:TolC family protein [Arcobacteraceae bacterium]
MNQAKALKQYSLLEVNLKEAAYLKEIYTLKTNIQRDKLIQKQSELTLKNSEINLFIITQKFKVGSADISQLNIANINNAKAKIEIIIVRNTLLKAEFELKKYIGENSIESIPLIDFELINKEIYIYIYKNLELLQYYAKNKNDLFNSKIIKSSFHPKLTFNSSYGYSDNKQDTYSVNDSDGNNYYYGLTFSLPFDINKDSTIDALKLVYLQSKISTTDRKMELIQEYNKHFQTIVDLKEKVMVAKDTSNMYFELYKFTSAQADAGFKSSYQIESLQNSVKIHKLEIKIQNFNILVEKISLYFNILH